ncbi:MAG: tRNA threonylcarbamoyladenosine dehydratase [Chitinivibrionales bacterium]
MTQFSRTELLLGQASVQRLSSMRVVVFGLGGVGSHALESLVRSGVGYVRIVDFDTVHQSNINRQLFALHSTAGMPKVEVAVERMRDINPHCIIEPHHTFASSETLNDLLEGPLDAVVDAIDSVTPKRDLLYMARRKNYFVVSSMGAAGRLDPSMIRVGDISETHNCPLARVLRKRLHRLGLYKGIRAVYSMEIPRKAISDVTTGAAEEFFQRGRERTPLGTISYLPAIFGYTAAAEAIQHFLNASSTLKIR